MDRDEGKFGLFDQGERSGPELRKLPAQLRTDRTTASSHQHRTSAKPRAHRTPVGRDRFAPPDVIDRCYDFRGDGVPVILVDGEAAGVWPGGEIELFDGATKKVKAAVEKRLADVKAFLET